MVFTDRSWEDRIDAAANARADAIEFWGWREKNLAEIEAAAEEAGLDIAAMLGSRAPLTDPNRRDEAVADIEASIEAAASISCPNLIVTVGQEQPDLDRTIQHEAVVSTLAAVEPVAAAADVTLNVEPLNTAVDHPGYYLTRSAEGYEIVNAVDSSYVRLLFDIYHQQVTEGNIIQSLREYADRIGYVHVADVPGRHEPGTGELDYVNICEALIDTRYEGYVGCEFDPVGDDVRAVANCAELFHR